LLSLFSSKLKRATHWSLTLQVFIAFFHQKKSSSYFFTSSISFNNSVSGNLHPQMVKTKTPEAQRLPGNGNSKSRDQALSIVARRLDKHQRQKTVFVIFINIVHTCQ
jgi:hypothetical protein